MAASAINSAKGTSSGANGAAQNTALQDIDTDHFLKLMIAELQNQDPLNPADNTQLLTQISQIRQVASSDKLSSTLDSVLLGQNLTSATSMIGKQISALGDDAKEIKGKVDKVSVAGGTVKLHIGEQTVGLKNIKEILPAA